MKWVERYLEGTKGEEKTGRGRRRGYICEIGPRRSREGSAGLLIGWLSKCGDCADLGVGAGRRAGRRRDPGIGRATRWFGEMQ